METQPRALKMALEAVANGSQRSPYASSDASEEDYDSLKHDPLAIIGGAKGGGFVSSGVPSPPDVGNKKQPLETSSNSRPTPTRLKSIPITLNKLEERGRYVLTADDEAVKEILKLGIERV
jgi:sterol O-acyltransferase